MDPLIKSPLVADSKALQTRDLRDSDDEYALRYAPADPNLRMLLAYWPDLPPAIREAILTLIRASLPTGPESSPR